MIRQEKQFYVHGFDSLETLPFKPEEYSYLKFGSDRIAKQFGYQLAEAFFKKHSDKLLSKRSVVIPSPYNYVKNAATIMSEHFVDKLNHLLAVNGGHQLEWSTIHRKVNYIKDYGFLDKDKRKALISGDEFHINKTFLDGKNLIFIDDVLITGTHEEKLIEILDKEGIVNDTFFLYYAKYSKGAVGADIEAAINFAGVKSISSFIELTKQKDHHLLVRPIKYLLGQDNNIFIDAALRLPVDFTQKLFYAALGEGYHKIDDYKENLSYLEKLIKL